MFQKIRKLFSARPKISAAPRVDSTKREQSFRLFLNAWSGFQETVTNIEYTLCCDHPFGMYKVHALCAEVGTQVYKCIQHLSALTEQPPTELRERFTKLHEDVGNILTVQQTRIQGSPYIDLVPDAAEDLTPEDLRCIDPATYRYIRLARLLPESIAPAFALTAAGCQSLLRAGGLQENIQKCIQECGGLKPRTLWKIAKSAEQLVLEAPFPPDMEREFLEHIATLREKCPDPTTQLLLRGRLWPLQHTGDPHVDYGLVFWGPEVGLHADTPSLLRALRRTLARRFSPQSLMYLRYRGLTTSSAGACIVCMAMPPVHISGIVHSNNPLQTTHTTMYMYACHGLPKVMEGTPYPEHVPAPHPLDAQESTEEHADAAQDDQDIPPPNPVDVIHVSRRAPHTVRIHRSANMGAPILSAEMCTRLAEFTLQIEELEDNVPQCITWTLHHDGTIHLVMARPIILAENMYMAALPDNILPKPLLHWGVCASPGIASGPVCHVRTLKDAKKFPKGGVLVVERDHYQWAALLDRASAVITSQGFWGSRLASLAREFGKPVIIDMAQCMDALKETENVTVYADTGAVYHEGVPVLLANSTKPKDFLPESQIYAILKEATAHILPLTLDPESADFKAKNCTTYHDIARYCHEKAVGSLFAFGSQKENAPDRVRQLVDGFPKQFWVIDVDTAFDNPPFGPTIDIKHIISPPLHSLWQGINAFAWQGPPPVDSKGLLAIFYEATANPHLDPAAQSAFFSEKNYILVGRNYCSLYSRFGFHFVSVEARIGRQKSENAVVFQLRGGAANIERRILRVRFVADLLWDCGLKPEITNDAVRARASGLDTAETLILTSVLGYLTIHTRQLDMIMTDTQRVAELRARMTQEYKTLLCG